jgi:hypothetical protein
MKLPRVSEASAWVLGAGLLLCALSLASQAGPQGGQGPSQGPFTAGGGQGVSLAPTSGFGTADSNADMIAVTGIDVTGSSVLFVVDTRTRHLAVYQAQGGTSSTMSVRLVGARNIDLDLQVDGYNDKSQFTYKELERRFQQLDQTEFPAEAARKGE